MFNTLYKVIIGIFEAALGFPIYGGAVIIALYWTPLIVMLFLHIIGLKLAKKSKIPRTGHVLGIITSSIGWIPVVGMTLHIITAFYLLYEAFIGKDHSSV